MNIKTAISIDEKLFKHVNMMAAKLKVSRSYLFKTAIEEFIERHDNQLLLQQLNQSYEDLSLSDNKVLLRHRRHHRNLVEGEW